MQDGNFTTPRRDGPRRYSAPIAGVNTNYVMRETWLQVGTSFTRTAIDTYHPSVSGYFLVEESDPTPTGVGGIVRWERVYAKKPDSHYDSERFAYTFIGFWSVYGINVITVDGRDRFTETVTSRIIHDYFRIGAGVGRDYANSNQIPIIGAQTYYIGAASQRVDALADSPPFSMATTPSRTTYESWITDAVTYGWSATIGKICVEDSTVTKWMGSIYRRSTRYVLAK